MGVCKIFTINKNLRRPRKTETEHRARLKVQKRRLVAMGFPEEKIKNLDSWHVRDLIKKSERKSTRKLVESRFGITLRI